MSTSNWYKLNISFFRVVALIIVLTGFFSYSSEASHIVGGEIGYRCLGGGQYEITLNVYRDCFYGEEDAQFDDPASVGIFNARTGMLLQEVMIPFTQDDTLSAIFQNNCLIIPSDVCVHTSTYVDTVSLTVISDGYEFVYQRCCRNQTIMNVVEPLETGATYNIVLTERAMRGCNSSPRFKEWPPIFVCVDEPIFYDHGAIDEEGDSLVYRLCTPFTGANSDMPQPQPPADPPYDTLAWVDPTFNLDNLLGAGRPLRVDPRRGFLFARPGLQGQFVVGVCVEEYRDGELLSSTRRDFQYNIGLCRETSAAIGSPEVQCDNLEVQFNSLSEEATDFVWNFDINDPNAVSREENPTYTYPDYGKYTIQLIVEPGKICSDTITREIDLQPNSLMADLIVQSFDCEDSSYVTLVDLSQDTVSFVESRRWEVVYGNNVITSNERQPTFGVPRGSSGTVTLTVQSLNSCEQTIIRSFETDINDPIALIPDELTICRGDSVDLNPEFDSTAVNLYRWQPSTAISNTNAPNPRVSPEATTTYIVRVVPPNGACELTKEVTVNVLAAPELVNFSIERGCFDGLTTKFFATVEGEPDSILWDFGDEEIKTYRGRGLTPSYTFPDVGRYDIEVIVFGNGCSDTLMQNIPVLDQDGLASFELALEKDLSVCTDSITLSANIVEGNPEYTWIDEEGNEIGANEEVKVSALFSTFYVIRATDFTGCVLEDTVRVSGNRPVFESSGDIAVCEGEDFQIFIRNLTPSRDSLSFQWVSDDPNLSGATTGMPEVSTTPGSRDYTVFVESTLGCLDTLDINVAIVGNDLQMGFDAEVQCDGTTVDFTNQSSQEGLEYIWLFGDNENSSAVGDAISFTYPENGIFEACLTLNYDLSCTDTICQEIEVEARSFTADFNANADSCSRAITSLTFENLSIDTAGVTYIWEFSNGGTSTEARPSIAFTQNQDLIVELTISDNESCELTKVDTIRVNILDLNVDSLITTCGGEIELNPNGNPNLVYEWLPATGLNATDVPSPIANPEATTNYTVIVSDPNRPGCSIQQDFTIELVDEIDFGLPDIINICEQETEVRLPSNVNVEVVWTDKDGQMTMDDFIVLPADYNGLLMVQVKESELGCSGQQVIQVRNEDGIDIIKPIGDTIRTCEDQTVQIVLENGRPQDEIFIEYFPKRHITEGDSTLTPTFFGFADTTTTLRYVATNQFGCVLEDSLIINVREFSINLPPLQTICQDNPTLINPNFNPDFEYNWSPSEGLSDPNSGNPDILISEPTTYQVTVTNGPGAGACQDVRTVELDVFPTFGFESSQDTTLCSPQDITLFMNADIDAEYEWSDSSNFSEVISFDQMLTVFVDQEFQTFYARAIDSFGCFKSNAIEVEIPSFGLVVPDTTLACANENFSLAVQDTLGLENLTYRWLPEEIIIGIDDTNRPIIRPEESVQLIGLVTNEVGCTDTLETFIELIDLDSEQVMATANPDTIIVGSTSQLDVNLTDEFEYRWMPPETLSNPNARNPVASPIETTTYSVEISKGTCSSIRQVEVAVDQGICKEPFIFVPSAFTPNGDGKNDILFVRGNPIDEVYFVVYNRWGQKMFETTDKNIGWDGRYKGRDLPPDVFGYYLEVTCFNGEEYIKKGDVSIIK
ncbi:MAG: PKD domain-containing protein [Bacteroidota bacterium]